MKKYVCLALMCMVTLALWAKKQPVPKMIVEEYNQFDILYGPVQSVKSVCYLAASNNGNITKERIMTYPFDILGLQPQSQREYDKDGHYRKYTVFNAHGLVIDLIIWEYDGPNMVLWAAIQPSSGDTVNRGTRTYVDGQLVACEQTLGLTSSSMTYKYTVVDGEKQSAEVYQYGKLEHSETYKYAGGKAVERVEYDAEGTETTRILNTWTAVGQIESSVSYRKGREMINQTYVYDKRHLLVATTESFRQGEPTVWQIEYLSFDKHNNWLTRKIFKGGNPDSFILEERTIRYY